jgi:hypothetical protein
MATAFRSDGELKIAIMMKSIFNICFWELDKNLSNYSDCFEPKFCHFKWMMGESTAAKYSEI